MVVTKYFCNGECGATVSEEQYKAGLVVCGSGSCSMRGKPFEKGFYCDVCKKRIREKEKDQHSHQ